MFAFFILILAISLTIIPMARLQTVDLVLLDDELYRQSLFQFVGKPVDMELVSSIKKKQRIARLELTGLTVLAFALIFLYLILLLRLFIPEMF